MSSSFGLVRDGRDRPLWGIFLASLVYIYIYLFQGALWRKRYGLIYSSFVLCIINDEAVLASLCLNSVPNSFRLIHLVHLVLGTFGFFNEKAYQTSG